MYTKVGKAGVGWEGWAFLAAAEAICFGESSLFLLCSALAVNIRFSSVERKHAPGRTDELQDPVSPTGGHPG